MTQLPINQMSAQTPIKREIFDIYGFHYVPFWKSKPFSILIFCIVVLFALISCSNSRDVINHHHRAGVMPCGTNKKLNR